MRSGKRLVAATRHAVNRRSLEGVGGGGKGVHTAAGKSKRGQGRHEKGAGSEGEVEVHEGSSGLWEASPVRSFGLMVAALGDVAESYNLVTCCPNLMALLQQWPGALLAAAVQEHPRPRVREGERAGSVEAGAFHRPHHDARRILFWCG